MYDSNIWTILSEPIRSIYTRHKKIAPANYNAIQFQWSHYSEMHKSIEMHMMVVNV